MSFTIRYAIPMKHESCARSVAAKLRAFDAVEQVDVDLPQQEAVVVGTLPPSAVVKAMQAAGRDAFVRGSGEPDSNAVCVLEDGDGKVHGLARLIEIAKGRVLVDVVLDAAYASSSVAVHALGDISGPPATLGEKILDVPVERGESTDASIQTMTTLQDVALASLIGRSVYVGSGLVGIVARSAGLWENDKTVCACTGKSMWEERRDARQTNHGLF